MKWVMGWMVEVDDTSFLLSWFQSFIIDIFILIWNIARIELFNGKGGLVEGCIERIDRTGADVVALDNPKLVSINTTQWHVFAAFGMFCG